jgi:hypothetical protein
MANGFLSFLKKFGQDALKVITLGAVAAETAAPAVTAANPAIGALLEGSAQILLAAETAGAAAEANAPSNATGPQKAALAVAGIEPLAQQFCQKLGLSVPTQEQVAQFNQYLVAALNVFGVVQQANQAQ